MDRRNFLALLSSGLGVGALSACQADLFKAAEIELVPRPVAALGQGVEQTWLGEAFWANRLQDWKLSNGWIECVRAEATYEVRTVSLLTRSLMPQSAGARLRMVLENVSGGNGFGGVLIGIGQGELDYRKCALVQRVAGPGGGVLLTVDETGMPSVRRFDDAASPLAYDEITPSERSGAAVVGSVSGAVELDCLFSAVGADEYDLLLTSSRVETGEILGSVIVSGLSARQIAGGMSLVSSSTDDPVGARWAFTEIEMAGGDIERHDDRAIGPVLGCLHSLNRSTLKMTVQCFPVSLETPRILRMDYRVSEADPWTPGPQAGIGDGFAALLRKDDWDSAQTWQYRIVDISRTAETLFSGEIRKDPGTSKNLKIALHSCLLPTARSLDTPEYGPSLPEEYDAPRYSADNLLFPHAELVTHCDAHTPDLYVFLGDQYYETYPTRHTRGDPDVKLDTLYRWYLWLWTFKDALAHTPCILLADDHDILQGNLWGQAGEDSELPREEDGGFKWSPDMVKMVYRIQCGHNPDSYDPEPIRFGIPVIFGDFVYGGVSFAFVEDRKFKSAPDYETPPLETTGILLGERQEAFLKAWKSRDADLPKICLTASIWGSPQTDENLEPLLDYDANGYPPDGRTQAVKLLRDANAIALAGDQHLGMVARQGVDSFEDGPVFFAGPAGAAFWQRWFEGAGALDNQRGDDPNTGNFVDTFGNPMRVLAVANPKLSHAEFQDGKTGWGKSMHDHRLKSEGYGIVCVDHAAQEYVFECWPWQTAPSSGEQFPGWPVNVSFAQAGSAE